MTRILLVAALLLAGCTAQPVSAPPSSTAPQVSTTVPTTSEPTAEPTTTEPATSEPTAEPLPEQPQPQPEEPAAKTFGCADVIPSDVMSELAGHPIDGAHEWIANDTVSCRFDTMVVQITTGSDEESFAQRRYRQSGPDNPHSSFPHWAEVPDFYDEAYRYIWGAESITRTYVAVRQGSVEVWLDWSLASPANAADFRERLFATVFERLG